ncbi:hypothetical protein tinsulaeT_19610 [Thalassotalea insulae]|uniref:Uncharacterized protein n=1 Tax=Thalassotalea insulae TaxID=2056778 RepID=A0ABQ6GWT5_9GAMM|nr:hypothetical protein tinsulaeT_19610 [Thalassotalea insulae]
MQLIQPQTNNKQVLKRRLLKLSLKVFNATMAGK